MNDTKDIYINYYEIKGVIFSPKQKTPIPQIDIEKNISGKVEEMM